DGLRGLGDDRVRRAARGHEAALAEGGTRLAGPSRDPEQELELAGGRGERPRGLAGAKALEGSQRREQRRSAQPCGVEVVAQVASVERGADLDRVRVEVVGGEGASMLVRRAD